MPPTPTPPQREVLAAIRDHWTQHGYAPSLRELAAATGRNLSTTHTHIDTLTDAGLVTSARFIGRTIRLTDAGLAAITPSTES